MSIDPAKFGGADPLCSPRVHQTGAALPALRSGEVTAAWLRPARAARRGDDHVSLSAAARVAGSTAEGAAASGIPVERLRRILQRISSNYYDTWYVRDQIAQRLRSEFRTPPAQ